MAQLRCLESKVVRYLSRSQGSGTQSTLAKNIETEVKESKVGESESKGL